MKWANQRLVFGKKLMDQPVIRQKLAKMIAHCEANQAWLENITYQMTKLSYKQQSQHLAGPIGLLKMYATRAAHEIADEAGKQHLRGIFPISINSRVEILSWEEV